MSDFQYTKDDIKNLEIFRNELVFGKMGNFGVLPDLRWIQLISDEIKSINKKDN